MNYRFSDMMNLSDDLVQRGASARRHHRGLRRRRIDLGRERQDDPVRNREHAGEGHHHHRSRRGQRPRRCPGRSSRWPAAARSCCSKTSPSGAMPKPESRHLARYDELTALPNRVNFRDEIERLLAIPHDAEQLSALAVRRPRPVQAGQRHAGSSLRRPAVVRGRRPAARNAAAGGFRGALRRRRIRGVSAEHQVERGRRQSRPPHRRPSERALQDRQSPGRDRRQRRHRDDGAGHRAPTRC